MKKINILFVCGAGLGSSFAAQMSAEDVLNKLGVEANLDHVDISTAASVKTDIIITAENFRSQFEKYSLDSGTSIVYLKNIVSKVEIEEKLTPVLQEKGII
ncbi:PTS sugar transporter subunit IIB [Vagococcus carniphilus]|uniref:PTS ascorbate transporter subunit IIB n=1 Tax=Vagococcus carniphilus TaxID=218144 RepID=A0A430AZW3_9ENTE|nr:PTS sugar transporter subunit IIB [Vagococcus carniphilus]MDT2831701.1 PTS sugar transporter subunit IIB [Vagococcus carniphilus]MDT2840554.1 PTS sugar transporter subunit IIB [Vagococcus carniphilus]MDT2855212.1 PTS sugar transporter subunit IIB [Vagococcus carniphilus]QNN72952.1 PTS sugar transporter subunit IIB [Vagococcus carniphilus]RSU13599.1 PTS ascorbate transporter subunit IIB [Vagococcus carniphilus]